MMATRAWLGIGILVVFLQASAAFAAGLGISIEPIAGYEVVQDLNPPPQRTATRMFYGARATLGVPLVSGEVEYVRANDTASQPSQTVATQDDRIKVGLVSEFRMGSLLGLVARAGGQAKQTTVTINSGTPTVYPLSVSPYAGAGFKVRLGRQISADAGATVIFNQWPDMTKNDYQTYAGFTVKFGTSDL